MTAGSAVAQRVDDGVTEADYVGDEPNTLAPGVTPYDWIDDPSASYPADANGLGPDRLDTAGLVLAVNWVNRVCAYGAPVGCAYTADQNSLLVRLGGGSFITPGLGQWWARYGTFHDANGDGWIHDVFGSNRVHASLRGDCDTELSTTDPNGIGAPQGANTQVSARCVGTDEFAPAEATLIVAYVTPGNWSDFGDVRNGQSPDTKGRPDFTFQGPIGTEGESTGRYFGPASNFDFLMLDNSLLETTVIEAISSPEILIDAPRTHEADADSLVEVDVYQSVDPTVEGLYQQNVVATFAGLGCAIDYQSVDFCPGAVYDATVGPTADPVLDEVFTVVGQTDRTVGPADDMFFPALEREQTHIDYSSPHLYFDQRVVVGASRSLVGSHSTQTLLTQFAPGDGERRVWAQAEVRGTLGVWTDKNGDGIIGNWTDDDPADGCPDPYDCGNDDDPNSYSYDESEEEFTPVCGAKETDAGKNSAGSYLARIESSTGSWGKGVYVLTDRKDATNSNADELRDDGRVPFNPYDDLVLDAADDQEVDSIVTSGPIFVHMLCRTPGAYNGYERLIFLDGVNLAFDVLSSGETGGDFTSQGVPTGERVSDADVYKAFDL